MKKIKITGYVSKETRDKIVSLVRGDYGVTPLKTESAFVDYACEKLLEEFLSDREKLGTMKK